MKIIAFKVKCNTIRGSFFLLMMFYFIGAAQVFVNKRIKLFGNAAGTAYSVIQKGNYFFIYGSKFFNYGSSWNLRYNIIKIDSLGDTLFTKSYGHKTIDYYSGNWGGTVSFKNGAYDFGTRTDSLNHSKDLLYKFDGYGDTIFSKLFGDTSSNIGYKVRTARKNLLVLTGTDDSIGSKGDFMLAKMDTNGNFIFKKLYGLPYYIESSQAVDTCKDGGYIMAGWRLMGNYYNTYVVKTDSLGNSLWQNTYSNMDGSSILTCKKSGYIITTSYMDSLIGGVGGEYFTRTNLIKINDTGYVLWSNLYGASSVGQFPAISYELANGDIVTCGQVGHSLNPPVNGNTYGIYGLIMRTDSAGNLKFYQTYEATTYPAAYNYLRDIKQLQDGGFIAAGFVQPNDGTSQDVWILRIDSNGCLVPGCPLNNAVQEFPNSKDDLVAFPNPSSGTLFVNYNLPNSVCETASIQIVDLSTGTILLKKEIAVAAGQIEMNIKDISAGVYSLSIKNCNSARNLKIIKLE